MQLEGHIKVIGETKTFGNNGFTKREFVLTTEGEYPQHIQIELIKDKCSLLDGFLEGEQVRVSINLQGREWTNPQGETKYFNSIQAWRIESIGGSQTQTQQQQAPPPPVQQDEEEDDLPI
jgi:single-stranded DNA-binding protein